MRRALDWLAIFVLAGFVWPWLIIKLVEFARMHS